MTYAVDAVDDPTPRIAEFVRRLAGRDVENDEPLISSQLLESIAAVQLIAFIEDALGVEVADDDLVLSHFDSVDAMVTLVRSKAATP